MLGVTCYYPVHLAVSDLSIIRTGSGLALEGALLAVIATSIAALSQRGIVRLDSSALRQLVALAGLGLALAGTWTKIFRVSGRGFSSYWVDGTLGGFPTILIVICAALVVFSLVTRHWWVLPAASALGWLIAGFFAFDLLQAVPNTNALGPATWLGVIGGVLTGLSAVSLRMFKDWQRHPVTVTPRRAFVWAATAAGLGLLLVSMWLDTEQPYVVSHHTFHNTYWSTVGDHSLGIAMLILAVSAIVALLGFVIARFPALGAWALAASLTLLGIAARQPAQEAFKHLGALRSGGWLALVGSLLASVGAAKMLLCGWPLERAKPEEETVDEVKAQPHAPVKGKQHRVPATRRAR
jgi:hypothetical protein